VEKIDVICRLLEHHNVEDLLPNYVTSGRLFEGDKGGKHEGCLWQFGRYKTKLEFDIQ
jgi:hypothetical protein